MMYGAISIRLLRAKREEWLCIYSLAVMRIGEHSHGKRKKWKVSGGGQSYNHE